jgi:hypothetical protein
LINDELVVAPKQHSLELAIDTAKGAPSLTSKAGGDWFKANTLQLKQPIMAFYVPDYMRGVQELLKSSKQPIPIDSATLEQLKKIKSVGGGIAIDDTGIRLKLASKTDGTTIDLPNMSAKTMNNFPTDTFAFTSGTGLAQIWTETTKILAAKPETQQVFTQMRQSFTQSTQLDLDKDVFSWMGGEYALGLMPTSTGITAQAGFGGGLTIDSTDRATTDNTMTKLANLAKASGVSVEQRQVDGKSITDIKVPGQGTLLSYGWLNDKSMLLAVGDGLMDKIVTHSGESLDRSPNFFTILSTMPQEKQSYAYFDLEKMTALFQPKLVALSRKAIPANVDALISSVQGVGMTSVRVDKTINRFEAVLALKPAQ